MWLEEYFEWDSPRFELRRMVTPKPVQEPHPPCWRPHRPTVRVGRHRRIALPLDHAPLDKMAEQMRHAA
jgi:hypothetical protein